MRKARTSKKKLVGNNKNCVLAAGRIEGFCHSPASERADLPRGTAAPELTTENNSPSMKEKKRRGEERSARLLI